MVMCDSELILSLECVRRGAVAFLSWPPAPFICSSLSSARCGCGSIPTTRPGRSSDELQHAKNSIVGWRPGILDERPLTPGYPRRPWPTRRQGPAGHVDLENAISGRRAACNPGGLWRGCWRRVSVCYFLIGPSPFVSLLKRTFNPFGAVEVSTRPRGLTLLKPEAATPSSRLATASTSRSKRSRVGCPSPRLRMR